MADFTRFISYLYDYRAGARNRNLGFAKVEARQGMCRIGVNLNHGQVLAQNMVLYGYVAEKKDDRSEVDSRGDHGPGFGGHGELPSSGEGGIWLVPLGEMERGSRERRWSFPLERLHSKGIALENLSGLILLSKDRESFLLSVWVDGPWRAEDIRQGELWESRREREDATKDPSVAASQTAPEISSEQNSMISVDMSAGKADRPDTSPRSLQDERDLELEMRDADHTRYQIDAENDRIAEDGRVAENNRAAQNNRVAENGRIVENDRMAENDQMAKNNRIVEDNARTERLQTPPQRSEPTCPARQDTSQAPDSWRKLCKLFPAARPFEPSAWEVLCISLQDIGRLPPENWVWGNNHFLLHGFYQYHHLILARHRSENRIYLGVPGEFGVNEKFMAAMFGLHQFQRERQGKSDKGYWLTPIRL